MDLKLQKSTFQDQKFTFQDQSKFSVLHNVFAVNLKTNFFRKKIMARIISNQFLTITLTQNLIHAKRFMIEYGIYLYTLAYTLRAHAHEHVHMRERERFEKRERNGCKKLVWRLKL